MPWEFNSYEAAKEYYDSMVNDRQRYAALNLEFNMIGNVLNIKEIHLGGKRRYELKEEMEVYGRVMKNLESTFNEKYKVPNVKQLSDKIRAFEPKLERLKALSQSYGEQQPPSQEHKSGSNGGDIQPPVRERTMSYDELYAVKAKEQQEKDLDQDDRSS